jgi:hypothetical protein
LPSIDNVAARRVAVALAQRVGPLGSSSSAREDQIESTWRARCADRDDLRDAANPEQAPPHLDLADARLHRIERVARRRDAISPDGQGGAAGLVASGGGER